MRGQSDKVVAIIVSRLDSLSENLAVQTMLPAFYEQGYDPIMMESQFSPQLVEEHLGMLQRRNIDGVVLFGFSGIKDEMLKPWQPSLVMMARDAHGFASVCYDDEGAIITLMQRLYDKGHRHISFLGVPHTDVTTGKRRHEAYLAFCKAQPPGRRLPAGSGHEARLRAGCQCSDPADNRAGVRHGYAGAEPANTFRSSASTACRWRASAARR